MLLNVHLKLFYNLVTETFRKTQMFTSLRSYLQTLVLFLSESGNLRFSWMSPPLPPSYANLNSKLQNASGIATEELQKKIDASPFTPENL